MQITGKPFYKFWWWEADVKELCAFAEKAVNEEGMHAIGTDF